MKVISPCFLAALLWLAASQGVAAAGKPPAFAARAEVQAFIADMTTRHDFKAAVLKRHFSAIRPLPAVLEAIKPPADPRVRSWQAYRARFIEPRRIAAGTRFWREHRTMLHKAQERFGVPAEIIVAIIGIESIYGRNVGRFDTMAALATLAFDYPPRAALFRGELEALLLLARDEKKNPLSYRGSYAGALGLPQFLPSSLRQWGTDFDGNGRVDLGNARDAIGSVAAFLYAHGWQPGEPLAMPVTLASGADPQPLLDEGIRPVRLPTEMAAMGVQTENAAERPAALIDLVTPDAPTDYWLGYQNFFVITRYNRSSFYAMAVIQFAEVLREAKEIDEVSPPGRPKAKRHARGASIRDDLATKPPE